MCQKSCKPNCILELGLQSRKYVFLAIVLKISTVI